MKLRDTRHQRGNAIHFLFSIVFSLFVWVNNCAAQVPPPDEAPGHFSSAYSRFAAREKITVVTEDAPFQDSLTTEKLEKLLADLKSEDLLGRAQAIADAFDYECVREGSVLILKKRYSDSRDLPFVPYEEACIALDHIERTLAPLDPPGRTLIYPDSVFYQFIDAITPEQMAPLRERQRMTILTPEQRRLLQAVCAKEYMWTYTTLSRINTWYLKQLTKPDAVFRWVEVVPETPKILILDGPLGLRGQRVQKGLSHGFEFESGGPSGLIDPRYSTPAARPAFGTSFFISDWDAPQTKMWKDALTDLRDRTAPTPEVMPAPPPAERITLGQAVERLTARAGGRESYEVDPALATKPVCLFGLENAPPRAVFDSLAKLYALDITQPQENVFRLIPPRPPRVRGYNDVLPVIRRCFPDPYQRYYRAQFGARMAFLNKPENMPDFAKQVASHDPKAPTIAHFLASQSAPYVQHTIYDVAVQRLRSEIEPRIAKAEDGLLKFRDSGVEAQRFFTILCLVEIFVRLDETAGPLTTMPGVTDADFLSWYGRFDSLTIQAQIPPNRSGMTLIIFDESGTKRLFSVVLGGRPPKAPDPPR